MINTELDMTYLCRFLLSFFYFYQENPGGDEERVRGDIILVRKMPILPQGAHGRVRRPRGILDLFKHQRDSLLWARRVGGVEQGRLGWRGRWGQDALVAFASGIRSSE